MNTNEEIEQAADVIAPNAIDMAEWLRGTVLNHPQPPTLNDPGTNTPYDDEWYNAYGTPDFAYGKALKIARDILRAQTTWKEVTALWISGTPSTN